VHHAACRKAAGGTSWHVACLMLRRQIVEQSPSACCPSSSLRHESADEGQKSKVELREVPPTDQHRRACRRSAQHERPLRDRGEIASRQSAALRSSDSSRRIAGAHQTMLTAAGFRLGCGRRGSPPARSISTPAMTAAVEAGFEADAGCEARRRTTPLPKRMRGRVSRPDLGQQTGRSTRA
jgi:hypothetical protein